MMKKLLIFFMFTILLSSITYGFDELVFYDNADTGVKEDNGWADYLGSGYSPLNSYNTTAFVTSPKSIKSGQLGQNLGSQMSTNINMTGLVFPIKLSGWIRFQAAGFVPPGPESGFDFTVLGRCNGIVYRESDDQWHSRHHYSSCVSTPIPNTNGLVGNFYTFEEYIYNESNKISCINGQCVDVLTSYSGGYPNNLTISAAAFSNIMFDEITILQNTSISLYWIEPTPGNNTATNHTVYLNASCPGGNTTIYYDSNPNPTTEVVSGSGVTGNYTVTAATGGTFYYKGNCGSGFSNSSVRSIIISNVTISSLTTNPLLTLDDQYNDTSNMVAYCDSNYNSSDNNATFYWNLSTNGVVTNSGSYQSYPNVTTNFQNFTATKGNTYLLGCSAEYLGVSGNLNTYSLTFADSATGFVIGRNVVTESWIPNVTVSITQPNSSVTVVNTGTTGITSFEGFPGSYTFEANKPLYLNKTLTLNWTNSTTSTFYLDLNFNATMNLYDEVTYLPYNTSNIDRVQMFIGCDQYNQFINLSSNVQDVEFNCSYVGVNFYVYYSGNVTYKHFDALSFTQPTDYYIYLIDPVGNSIANTKIILDDFLGIYDNPIINIKKKTPTETITVFSQNPDIEDSVKTDLIKYQEYIISITSDNQPEFVYGTYVPTESSTIIIRLYNLPTLTDGESFDSTVSWRTGKYNKSVDTSNVTSYNYTYAYAIYNDTLDNTDYIIWSLYLDSTNNNIYNVTSTESQVFLEYNITEYLNNTIISEITMVHNTEGQKTIQKIINQNNIINLPVFQYVSQNFINFSILIILGILALSATIRSANGVSLALIGLASLFVMFGWFTLSSGVLGLSAIVAILNLIGNGDKQ